VIAVVVFKALVVVVVVDVVVVIVVVVAVAVVVVIVLSILDLHQSLNCLIRIPFCRHYLQRQ